MGMAQVCRVRSLAGAFLVFGIVRMRGLLRAGYPGMRIFFGTPRSTPNLVGGQDIFWETIGNKKGPTR